MANSDAPLRIGGNSVWGEYFSRPHRRGAYFQSRAGGDRSHLDDEYARLRAASNVQPTQSSSITVDSAGRRVWVANPDSDTVTALNADTLAVQTEISVGKRP